MTAERSRSKEMTLGRCFATAVGLIVFAMPSTVVEADDLRLASISKETLWRNREGKGRTWFHPRACMMPGPNGRPVALMTLQEIGGSDYFGQVHWSMSADLGMTWSDPKPIAAFGRDSVRGRDDGKDIGKFRGTGRGVIADCEGGYYVGDRGGGSVFDKQGKKIKEISPASKRDDTQKLHMANFVEAVRSRKAADLNAEAEVGHVSAACSHMANISYRLGKIYAPNTIREMTSDQPELSDAFQRCDQYLQANGVNLNSSRAVVGPWVTWDSEQERFVDEFADAANELSQPVYRKPFEVPRLV